MKTEPILESVIVVPLGEIRMGCDAYGLIINTNFGNFEQFAKTPILVGTDDYSNCIQHSSCRKYILIRGEFHVYILNLIDQTISVYKATIRGESGVWSEEQAIYGKEKYHINSFSRHYYLQFPFVHKQQFYSVLAKYEALRKEQINVALNAM